MTCGIYCLYFECDDGQYYIGKSLDVQKRYKRHYSKLITSTHGNYNLQKGFNIFGAPTIQLLEEVLPEELTTKEILWIDIFDSFKNGMNETMGGDGAGYGEQHLNAIHTEQDYEDILHFLAYTNLTFREIAVELDVSYHVVGNIGSNLSHAYLESIYPEEYRIMLTKIGTRHVGGVFTQPLDIYHNILKDLAYTNTPMDIISNKYSVGVSIVMDISKGHSHKYLKEKYPEEYSLLESKRGIQCRFRNTWPKVKSSEGVVYNIENSAAFAREHGLDSGGLSRLLNFKQGSVKGWTLA